MSQALQIPILLIVADNPSITFWIKKHLTEQFFIIDASTRREALDALDGRIDFIIVDSSFENCDPLELCKEMSQKTVGSLIPILLITGRLKKSFRDHALDSGVTDFLSDQLDLEELETRIAIGKKATLARKKTSGLSSAIHIPKKELSSAYLKKKFLLNNQALHLLAEAKTQDKPIALLFVRIDDFAQLQDRFGYQIADEILIPFSDFVSHFLSEDDLLMPSSEGGFVLLLPNRETKAIKSVAEQFHKEILSHPFSTYQGPIHLTVSIAFSPLEANEGAFNRTIESAIQSLRQALPATNLIISIDPKRPR